MEHGGGDVCVHTHGVSVNSWNLGNPRPLAVAILTAAVSIAGSAVCGLHPMASASEAFYFKDSKEKFCYYSHVI